MSRSIGDVQTAVVGCGNWGKNHVRVFDQRADLRVCCDRNEQRLKRIGDRYPEARTTSSFEQVLAADDAEALVIATPAEMHAEMAIAGLEAGKDVLVEKPLALTVEDAERVVNAANQADRVVGVGHLLVYHPAVQHLKRLIDDGELGEVYYCYGQRVNLGKIRAQENALWSLAPHDVSVMLHLFGEKPVEVEATGRDFLQDGIEDVVFLDLHFPSGRIGHVQVSWLDPHKERKLTVVGSNKMAVFDDMSSREKLRLYDKGADIDEEGRPGSGVVESLTVREGDLLIPHLSNAEPLDQECVDFLEAVVSRDTPRADGLDGLEVVKVLERAETCLRERRSWREPVED